MLETTVKSPKPLSSTDDESFLPNELILEIFLRVLVRSLLQITENPNFRSPIRQGPPTPTCLNRRSKHDPPTIVTPPKSYLSRCNRCSKTRQPLLKAVASDLFETVAKVYTFGEEEYSGKRLQNFPCRPTVRLGKFVSGTLNWIAEGAVSDDRCVILSPDVGTEHMANSRCLIGTVTIMYLGCVDDEGVCVQDSWTKLMATPNIVMPTSNPITPARDQQEICRWHFSLVLLYLSEDGVVLVKTMVSKLFLYNSNDEGFDFPRIGEEFGFNYLHLYHESLVVPDLVVLLILHDPENIII
ncbi:hypothetical protein GmHk_20G058618 [Glycine max]|nr:hypothetical protein GmHk_20G058618 [Glycine max]